MQGPLIQLRGFSYFENLYAGDPLHVTVTTPDQLSEMVRRCQAAPILAADTETEGLRWDLGRRVVGYVFSCFREDGATQSYYVPFRHATGEAQLPESAVQQAIRDIFHRSRADQLRLWWNLPFDKHMMRGEGIELDPARDVDVQIAARLWDENTSARLKDRALLDLGYQEAHIHEELLGREVSRIAHLYKLKKAEYLDRYGYSQIPIHMAGAYACRDGKYTLEAFRFYAERGVISYYSQSPRGPQYPGIWHTENRLAHDLCDVEEWGLPVDRAYLEWLRGETSREAERLESRVWDALGHHRRINLDSDDELRWLLTKVLGLQLYKKTKRGGELSVDREVLDEFAGECPVLSVIADRRDARKIASTYTDSLLEYCDANGVIHGQFKQNGTDTGRASMEKPNLQNIAADSDERAVAATGKKLEDGGQDPWSVRRAFTCRPGYYRLYIDWSQVELREIADASGDPELVSVYRTGGDVHERTTMLIWGRVDKSLRRTAKVANFGTSYGLTVQGLARRAKIPMHEAEAFMAKFWQAYAGIDAYRRNLWETARRNGGWITNKFGRTRRVPDILSTDERVRASAERRLMASRIQGGAGDLSKDAFVRVAARLRAEGLDARIAGWVHDELAIDVAPRDLVRTAIVAKAEMEFFADYRVPIVADAKFTTTHWAEKQSIPGLH